MLLAKKLSMPLRICTYTKRNLGSDAPRFELPDDFSSRVREKNQLDQQLYDWMKSDLLSEYIAEYSGDFSSDLQQFQDLQRHVSRPIFRPLIDSIYRNAYIKPVTGMIRLGNGLPYGGSYAHTDSREQ